MAATRANLAEVMTDAAYAHMFTLATRLADGLRAMIARHGLGCGGVTQWGRRTEFQFTPTPPRNGSVGGPDLEARRWSRTSTSDLLEPGPGDRRPSTT